MHSRDDGYMVGKPTLLATYPSKLDAEAVRTALAGVGYPSDDISVYYRVAGTDQVLDATTGQVAAGQALSADDLKGRTAERLETLVLMHPNSEQFAAVQATLRQFGQADIKYAERSIVGGNDSTTAGEIVPTNSTQGGQEKV